MRLIVLGMHRSGTSAVGRVLTALGVPTADPEALIGADPSNRHGHFEVRELTDFNDRLLGELGGHWSGPPPIDRVAMGELASGPTGREARALLDGLLPEGGFWKDPRLCLLMDFWRPIVEPPVAMWVGRHPTDVAASLHRRNGLPPSFGARLWERYTRQGLGDIAGVATLHVGYERLLDDPDTVVSEMADFVVGHGVASSVNRAAAVAAVDPQIRHHRSTDIGLSGQQEAVVEYLETVTGRVVDTPPDLGPETPGAAELFALRALDGPLLDRGEMARQQADVLSGEVQRLTDELGAAQEAGLSEIARLESEASDERHRARSAVDRLETELAELRSFAQSEVDRIMAELDERTTVSMAEIDRLNEALVVVHAERDAAGREANELRQDLRVARGDVVSYTHRNEQLATANEELARRVGVLQAQLDEIVGSSAWQAVAAGRKVVERALPVGTRRRAAYGSSVRGARQVASSALERRRPAPTQPGNTPLPSVTLPDDTDAVAAIVIPTYGQREVLHRCLESIATNANEASARVVVVDDASPDDVPEYLAGCRGLTVVTNSPNLGYLGATNAGVAASGRSEFVVLLNNDTEVTPGWLDELLAPFADPTVGAVGARLVYPDGRLQEAGSIIWQDGTGWNYGKGDDPNRFAYGYVREVDFCSAACLAVRRELWDRFGGFDERFVPAYYEDVDLCFSIRDAGFRVLYQPTCVVVHHEGVSHGTDVSSGLKAHQVVNHEKFAEKWAGALVDQHPPDPANVRRAADRRSGPSVLIVDHMVPTPDRDAGSLRMDLLVDMFHDLGYRVRFLPANRYHYPPYGPALEQRGVEVAHGNEDFEAYLREIGRDVDVALLSRPMVAVNVLPAVRQHAPHATVIFDMVDFHALREQREDRLAGSGRTAPSIVAEVEAALFRSADVTFAVSQEEADAVRGVVPHAVVGIVPTVHDAALSEPAFAERDGLLFVGSWNHPPNRDAISYLVDDLMPRLRHELPGVRLVIVGSDVPPDLGNGADDVEVLGWVEDLDAVFDRVRLSVAPLRYGAGVKGKVGDSLIRGVPVVTTSIGAEGFGFGHGFELDVGDDPAAFVAAVARLYDDEATWRATRRAGREAGIRVVGYEAVREKLEAALALADVGAG